MRLTTALNEYKATRDERLSEAHRTTTGAFAGHWDRLVHVDADGALRDYSHALSGLSGIDRSRLGILTGDDTHWFSELETIRQHYYRDTSLLETEYDAGSYTVHQYDLTLGRAHVTHVELRGAVPLDTKLVAFVTMAPEGKEGGVGALIHKDGGPNGTKALEVYHRREHDYLSASTGLDDILGQRPERFAEILGEDPVTFPRKRATEHHEHTRLSGDFLVTAPLVRRGRSHSTTLVSQLSDHELIDRETALADLRACARNHTDAEALRSSARERTRIAVNESVPRSEAVRTDLRVIDLLSGSSGGRIAAPEYDPFFAHSGGYGYVWFRDDAEVSRSLLEAEDRLGLDTSQTLVESATFLCQRQLGDGTWPHRVWATDGTLAPGWANANVEHNGESTEYQADQTATVMAFLATLLRERRTQLDEELKVEIRETIISALEALEKSIAANDLPEPCQNVWEDTVGQLGHTAAMYIEGFAAVARAPLRTSACDQALAGAERILDGLEELWDDDRGAYVMRLSNGRPDSRLDGGTLTLAAALYEYDSIDGVSLTDAHLDRLAKHTGTLLDTLFRNPRDSEVAGLIRYEGDRWRRSDQDEEKIWSVTTSMGALAAARVSMLLERRDRNGDAYLDRASDLYRLIAEDGPFTNDAGYLAEQVFDDGELDSATPLGWSHALRLRTIGLLNELNALPTSASRVEGPSERPTWTTGEKFGIGTVADHSQPDPARVWFTLTRGGLTEARFPRVDLMNLRVFDFLISCNDETGYTVRTHLESRLIEDTVTREVEPMDDESLLFRHVFTETGDGQGHEWQMTVEYVTDPEHDAIVADVSFESADGNSYDVFAVTDVALTNTGIDDRGLRTGPSGEYDLVARDPRAYTGETDNPILADENREAYSVALAITAATRFDWATVGVAGSDHLDPLYTEGALPQAVDSVDHENIVLIGRLGSGEQIAETLALGFARYADTTAALGEAKGALDRGYERVKTAYAQSWHEFLADKSLPAAITDEPELAAQYRTALMTLMAVEDKTFHGASIASPSVPWGQAVTAEEPRGYGYNFVWSRDLYQVFTAFDIVGSTDIATNQLEFIYQYQQDESGFIPQNTSINGITRWGGEQMDNISYPQVMAYHLAENGIEFDDVGYDFEHIRRSADYVIRHGPATAQERWEEESGYSPSSIAAEIAGLACAGKLALDTGHETEALVWLGMADHWANNVEHWTATDTGTKRHPNTPYYVRITRDGDPEAGHLRTLANNGPTLDERNIIDAGFLDLVRLGILPATDSVIQNSVLEVDETIRVEADPGAGFYRYNGDGYGERDRGDSGAPWSVEHKGKGRIWPLLTGERGEYELNLPDPSLTPMGCLKTMQRFANSGRMIPEQVWDREHRTEYNWIFGEGTGSATPLAWAMAQFVRLAHGISAGQTMATPTFVHERFREQGLHLPDRSPAMRVDTQFHGNQLIVSGETTGVIVAIKTPVDGTTVTVEDGQFEASLAVEPGENTVVVAAADDYDLETAGTIVRRLRL